MTHPDIAAIARARELQALAERAMEAFHAMSPAQQAAHHAAQRESFIRAFAPCEHGDPDWETCPQCRDHLLSGKQA